VGCPSAFVELPLLQILGSDVRVYKMVCVGYSGRSVLRQRNGGYTMHRSSVRNRNGRPRRGAELRVVFRRDSRAAHVQWLYVGQVKDSVDGEAEVVAWQR